jgi:hypothetical protein
VLANEELRIVDGVRDGLHIDGFLDTAAKVYGRQGTVSSTSSPRLSGGCLNPFAVKLDTPGGLVLWKESRQAFVLA